MATYDIDVKQGSTYELLITIKDPNDTEIDLTGHTFRGQIRTSTSDSTIQAAFSFVLADQVTNTGEVTATLSASATAAISLPENDKPTRKITKMIYDIESEDAGGIVTRWLEGDANISPEVTK
jgi:hypothetical protein